MKKVCIFHNDIAFGGTDTFVINLSQGLIHDDYDITVVLSAGEKCFSEERERELKATGVKIVKTCSLNGGLKSKLKHLRLLYKELKSGKYDVFQTNIDLFNGPNLFIAWLAGVPVRVCHSHNANQAKALKKGRSILIRLYQRIMRWMCWTFSNRRAGCSPEAMNFLFGKKWKKDKNSKVVYNGIDLSKFCNLVNVEEKKNNLGLSNRLNILTVGRMDIQKNSIFIAEVFSELAKIRNDVDLVWCGIGELQGNIEDIFTKNCIQARVHLLGTRSDVNEIMQCCDLFFLPSNFEGLGIVLLEAQAAQLQCLTSTNVPADVNCGGCIYLDLNNSIENWIANINELLNKKGIYKVDMSRLNLFTIQTMVKSMEEIFEL